VLRKQRDLAAFPLLSANIYRSGQRMFEPYKLFNLGGLRVAVLGLTTEDTQKMVHPDNIRDLEFHNPIQEAARLIPELRTRADVVIAATHMGHYEDGHHGTQAPGDVEMARAVRGIDLIVGGHSQNPACMQAENVLDRAYVPGMPCVPDRQNGTWIVQAHEWGKYVGRADFEYRRGEFKLVRYALIPVNLKKPVKGADSKDTLITYTPAIAEDRAVLDLLTPFQEFGQKQLMLEVGSTDSRLEGDRAVVRSQPTTLGYLVGLAMIEKTHADFALVNAGGVRDSLPAGKLTYKDILKVHPFGNTVVTVDMSGAQVLSLLQTAAAMTPGSGAFPQLAGVTLAVRAGAVHNVVIQGKPLRPDANYHLVTNNFVASGGDGYPRLTAYPGFVDTGYVDADVLRSYLAKHSPIQAGNYAPGTPIVRN
jgi:5'-nucleotidase/UDP-sugar diphosphatase